MRVMSTDFDVGWCCFSASADQNGRRGGGGGGGQESTFGAQEAEKTESASLPM